MLGVERIDLYYGASQALKNVTLDAEIGEVTCVMGRNGVGKTSLMRAIVGHQSIKGGKIYWDSHNISKLAPHQRARQGIAYVPQGRDIFSQLTVLENLKVGFGMLPKAYRQISDEIFDLFPVLKEMLKRRGGDLSGGQQQQLAIARALVTRPKLLILDEPTEGIQPSIIKDIQNVISLLRDQGQMAIVLVEQYFDFAKALADRYVILDRGEVVMSGGGADLQDTQKEQEIRRFITV